MIFNKVTPYEMIFNKVPDISNLKPFYSPGMVYLSKDERAHILSKRAMECRLLGYDKEAKNGYVVWVPELQRIKRTVNVRFKEDVDITKDIVEDELRDLTRFKILDIEDHEQSIASDEEFFEHEDDVSSMSEDDRDNDDEDYDKENEELEDGYKENDINYDVHNLYFKDEIPEEKLKAQFAELDKHLSKVIKRNREGKLTHIDEERLAKLHEDIKLPPIPKNIIEAYDSEHADEWLKAIDDELKQLKDAGAYRVVKPGKDEKVAKMRLVFQSSLENEFKIKFKVRLVLCGYSQIYGINYLETYAPTIARDTLRMILLYLLIHRMIIIIYDVKGAFIEGINDYRILGQMPKELFPVGSEPVIVEWIKSLYGEKQAAYIWYLRLKEILCDKMGFDVSIQDEALFYYMNENSEITMVVCVYVDDLLVGSNNEDMQKMFQNEFVVQLKRINDVKKYLGMEFTRQENVIYLNQPTYIESMINSLTEEEKLFLRKRLYPISPTMIIEKEEDDDETWNLLPMVGKLRYLVDCTRPDCSVSLGIISEHAEKGNYKQLVTLYKLLAFLKTTKDLFLKLYTEKYEDLILFAFCDASYDITNGHSRLGGVFYLGYESGCFSYFSKKDITISNSAMEAEVRAIERTIRKVVIYRDLLKEIGHIQLEPTVIYSDSDASVLHFQHYKNSNKLRHLMKLLHTIRHAVNQGWIILKFIKSEFNVADGLTKLLSKDKFLQFQTWLFYGYHYLELKDYIQNSQIKDKRKRRLSILIENDMQSDTEELVN
jgi:hypothetical protein